MRLALIVSLKFTSVVIGATVKLGPGYSVGVVIVHHAMSPPSEFSALHVNSPRY